MAPSIVTPSLSASNAQLADLGLNSMIPSQDMEQSQEEKDEQSYVDELFQFDKFRIIGKQLYSDWSGLIEKTIDNRELRKFPADPEEMREVGDIGEDETFVADRVIDNNIKREQPAFLNFLTAARNIVTFTRKDTMSSNEKLEEKFTRGAKYTGWEMPWIKETDGSSAHGWDAVEVIFDDSKPLKFSIEHIGHDKLFFALGSQELNAEEIVMREYDMTCSKMREYVKTAGFKKEVVDTILADKTASPQKRFQNNKVYKVYMKVNQVVYIAWASFDGACKDWLRAPEKLRLGIKNKVTEQVEIPPDAPQEVIDAIALEPTITRWVDVDIEAFPVFLLVYNDDEQKTITSHLGRAHLDLPVQEASTVMWTAQANQAIRSSYLMFSVDKESGSGAAPKQTTMKMGNGVLFTEPAKQFKLDEPTGGILKVLQALKMQNMEAVGQTLQSTLSKGPSARTTGVEIETAKEQQAQLSMINLLLFSMHIRDVYTFGWKITQSQILQGNLWEGLFSTEEIATDYELRAGGDTDVIERGQKLAKMMQFWPIVSTTPAASMFLISMLQLAFPTECAPWVEALKQQDPRMVAAMLSDLLIATLTPEETAGLTPEQQQLLQQAVMAAQQYKTALAVPSGPKNDNAPTEGAPVKEDNKV